MFRDGVLVWKTSRGGKDEVKREKLSPVELQFYCDFFARAEIWAIARDRRTGLTGQLASSSAVTLVRSNGDRITLRFDEFSTDTADSSSLRSALEGLKGLFLSPLPPATRFHPDLLAAGGVLIVQADAGEAVLAPAGLKPLSRRDYGRNVFHFFGIPLT